MSFYSYISNSIFSWYSRGSSQGIHLCSFNPSFIIFCERAQGRPKKNWMEGIKKAMNERNLNEGQWEDRNQWSLRVRQHRKTFWTRYIHKYISGQQLGSLHGPVLIFQPTVDSITSDKQGKLCLQPHSPLRELHSFYVLTYKSGILEGFRRWRVCILLHTIRDSTQGSGVDA